MTYDDIAPELRELVTDALARDYPSELRVHWDRFGDPILTDFDLWLDIQADRLIDLSVAADHLDDPEGRSLAIFLSAQVAVLRSAPDDQAFLVEWQQAIHDLASYFGIE